jgi:hypothetical protein
MPPAGNLDGRATQHVAIFRQRSAEVEGLLRIGLRGAAAALYRQGHSP